MKDRDLESEEMMSELHNKVAALDKENKQLREKVPYSTNIFPIISCSVFKGFQVFFKGFHVPFSKALLDILSQLPHIFIVSLVVSDSPTTHHTEPTKRFPCPIAC